MREVVSKIVKLTKDYVFPIFCLGCNQEGVWLCGDCLKKIDLSGVCCCPVCHKETARGVSCSNCISNSYLDAHIASTVYKERELIGKLIQGLKYQYVEELREVFSSILSMFFDKYKNVFEVDLVTAVPLHKKRLAERGFNQAEVLGGIVADLLNKPKENILKRHRQTKQQAKLLRQERLKNVGEAFGLIDGVEVEGKRILVVDDVFTTGSTVQECAKVLKEAGCEKVIGFSVARG